MATQADVRRIALTLPETIQGSDRFSFGVLNKGKVKGYAWVWLERIDPRKGRVPQPKVLAIRTASLDDKEFLLGLSTRKFFTEPHYNGYPAVLVRLAEVRVAELRGLLTEAWRCQAPKALGQAFSAGTKSTAPKKRTRLRGKSANVAGRKVAGARSRKD